MAYGSRCAAEARRARGSSRAVGRQQADCDALCGERRLSRACREASCRADLARGRCPGLGEKLTTTSARAAPQGLQADLRAATRSRARFTRTPCCVRYECWATKDSSRVPTRAWHFGRRDARTWCRRPAREGAGRVRPAPRLSPGRTRRDHRRRRPNLARRSRDIPAHSGRPQPCHPSGQQTGQAWP